MSTWLGFSLSSAKGESSSSYCEGPLSNGGEGGGGGVNGGGGGDVAFASPSLHAMPLRSHESICFMEQAAFSPSTGIGKINVLVFASPFVT